MLRFGKIDGSFDSVVFWGVIIGIVLLLFKVFGMIQGL